MNEMLFTKEECELIVYCLEQQSIDFNEIEQQDMTSILIKLRQQSKEVT